MAKGYAASSAFATRPRWYVATFEHERTMATRTSTISAPGIRSAYAHATRTARAGEFVRGVTPADTGGALARAVEADDAALHRAAVEYEAAKLRHELTCAESELRLMQAHPFASPCGEADAVGDRIDSLRAELLALEADNG